MPRSSASGDGNEAERLDLLKAHRERVERQLTEVTGHLRAIDHKIGLYEGKLEQRLLRPLTSSALEGVGWRA